MNVLEVMRVGPVIPVIIIDELKQAVPLAKALVAGGVRVLEVTLRTPVALEAIRAIASEVGEAIIGVGTISRPEDFVEAAAAGARFGVSPGLTPSLIDGARASGLPLLPGVMTPSEVIAARAAGYERLLASHSTSTAPCRGARVIDSTLPHSALCRRRPRAIVCVEAPGSTV